MLVVACGHVFGYSYNHTQPWCDGVLSHPGIRFYITAARSISRVFYVCLLAVFAVLCVSSAWQQRGPSRPWNAPLWFQHAGPRTQAAPTDAPHPPSRRVLQDRQLLAAPARGRCRRRDGAPHSLQPWPFRARSPTLGHRRVPNTGHPHRFGP